MKIKIEQNVFDRIFQYAKGAKLHLNSEITGWGHYTPSAGIYKLAPLREQTVTGGAQVEQVGQVPAGYDVSDLLVQWHSHVDLPCMWSNPDEDNIKSICKLMPMLISIVVNCRGEYKARLDYSKIKVGNGYMDLDKQVTVELTLEWRNDIIPSSIMDEITKNLIKKEYPIRIWENENFDGANDLDFDKVMEDYDLTTGTRHKKPYRDKHYYKDLFDGAGLKPKIVDMADKSKKYDLTKFKNMLDVLNRNYKHSEHHICLKSLVQGEVIITVKNIFSNGFSMSYEDTAIMEKLPVNADVYQQEEDKTPIILNKDTK